MCWHNAHPRDFASLNGGERQCHTTKDLLGAEKTPTLLCRRHRCWPRGRCLAHDLPSARTMLPGQQFISEQRDPDQVISGSSTIPLRATAVVRPGYPHIFLHGQRYHICARVVETCLMDLCVNLRLRFVHGSLICGSPIGEYFRSEETWSLSEEELVQVRAEYRR